MSSASQKSDADMGARSRIVPISQNGSPAWSVREETHVGLMSLPEMFCQLILAPS